MLAALLPCIEIHFPGPFLMCILLGKPFLYGREIVTVCRNDSCHYDRRTDWLMERGCHYDRRTDWLMERGQGGPRVEWTLWRRPPTPNPQLCPGGPETTVSALLRLWPGLNLCLNLSVTAFCWTAAADRHVNLLASLRAPLHPCGTGLCLVPSGSASPSFPRPGPECV